MNNESKKILDSWVEYLKLEDFVKYKIDKGIIDDRTFFRFNQNNPNIIILDSRNKEVINNKYDKDNKFRILKNQNGEDVNNLYLLLPIISLTILNEKKEKLKYLIPLISIKLTSFKKDIFTNRPIEIDLYNKINNINILNPILKKLFNISIENLPKNQSINSLICSLLNKSIEKDSFSKSLNEFKDFLKKKLDNPNIEIEFEDDGFFHHTLEDTNFNESLINELEIIKDLPNIPKDSLFNKYLLNSSNVSEKNINEKLNNLNNNIWYGSFDPKFPLAKGQACLMQNQNNLIAVRGAPGTGKTTLFLSIIANSIVKKALNNINGELHNNQMLITSTSNKAVDNVTERFTSGDEFTGIKDLYFIGGKKDNINKSISRAEEYITFLSNTEYNKFKHENLRDKILTIKNNFDKEKQNFLINYEEFYRNYKIIMDIEDASKLSINDIISNFLLFKKEFELNNLENYDLTDLYTTIEILKNIKTQFGVKDKTSLKIKEELKFLLDEVQLSIKLINKMSFFKFEFLGKPRQKIIKNLILNSDIEIFEELNIDNIEQFELLLKKNIQKFDNCSNNISLSQGYKLINLLMNKKFVDSLDFNIQQISKYKEFNYNYGDYFRLSKIKENYELYQLSLEYNRMTALRNKNRVIQHLEYWIYDVLKDFKNLSKKSQPNFEEFFNDISLVYPILTSTLSSSNNFFKKYLYSFNINSKKHNVNLIDEVKPLDLILSDESGMATIQSISTLMYKSNKAIIVGDPAQIPPVIALKSEDEIEYNNYYENIFKEPNLASRYYPLTVTAYHRAAGCDTGNAFDIGDGIILDEHRRCQKDIAEMFVKVANYQKMKIETIPLSPEKSIELNNYYGKNNIAVNVLGTKGLNNSNQDEINEIEDILKELSESGYNLKTDIGIITPYADQEKLLINKFKSKLNHSFDRASIGTVHKFQGVEFKVIIFSTVLTGDMSTAFINNEPNLINVAISRAKNQFILVGNLNKIERSGGYLEKMYNHIKISGLTLDSKTTKILIKEINGEIDIENKDSIIENYQNKDKILFTCDHIKEFEELINNAKKSILIISPWIKYSNSYKKESIQFDIINKLKKSNKNIKVEIISGYFGNKNKNEEQDATDLIKKYKNLLGNDFKYNLKVNNRLIHTHEKILLIDDKILVIGSFNWLSHAYYPNCKLNSSQIVNNNLYIRREISILSTNTKIIDDLKSNLKDMV